MFFEWYTYVKHLEQAFMATYSNSLLNSILTHFWNGNSNNKVNKINLGKNARVFSLLFRKMYSKNRCITYLHFRTLTMLL